MTKLYVTEYCGLKLVSGPNGVPAQCPEEPPLAEQVVDYSAGAAASAAFNAKTKFIRVHADSICSRLIAAAPVATTAKARMSADQTEYIGLPPDHGSGAALSGTVAYKISAITNT